jgi:hypothetical protein
MVCPTWIGLREFVKIRLCKSREMLNSAPGAMIKKTKMVI